MKNVEHNVFVRCLEEIEFENLSSAKAIFNEIYSKCRKYSIFLEMKL